MEPKVIPSLDVAAIARIAHEMLRQFQFLVGGPEESVDPIGMLDNYRRLLLFGDTCLILSRPEIRPEVWHQMRLEKDREAGWKFGYTFKPELLEDPLCADWDECPPSYQAAKTFFWGAVVTLGIESSHIFGEALGLYMEANSEDKAQEELDAVAEAITQKEGE